MKRIHFFAIPGDIVPLLRRFEANAPVKFIETGILSTADRPIYPRASQLPEPGI